MRSEGSRAEVAVRPTGCPAWAWPGLLLGLALMVAAGCSAEEVFIGDATYDSCLGSYPVCQTKAGCVLDESHYIEGRFPGGRQLIVRTEAAATLHVVFLFLDQRSAGNDLEVRWYEPGCYERYVRTEDGPTAFRIARRDGVYRATHGVQEGGEHLVEFFSDAFCEYLVRVEVD